MNQKLIIPILMILTCSFLISGMYAGESITFPLNITNPIYTVTGNSSNLNGLNVTYSDGNATIHTSPLMKEDNFTIVFLNQEKEIVHKHHHHGGGNNILIRHNNKTINNTIEVPYCNESCYNETQQDTNKTDDNDKEEKDSNILKFILAFVALWLIVKIILRLVNRKSVVDRKNNNTSERRNEEDGNKQETKQEEKEEQ